MAKEIVIPERAINILNGGEKSKGLREKMRTLRPAYVIEIRDRQLRFLDGNLKTTLLFPTSDLQLKTKSGGLILEIHTADKIYQFVIIDPRTSRNTLPASALQESYLKQVLQEAAVKRWPPEEPARISYLLMAAVPIILIIGAVGSELVREIAFLLTLVFLAYILGLEWKWWRSRKNDPAAPLTTLPASFAGPDPETYRPFKIIQG